MKAVLISLFGILLTACQSESGSTNNAVLTDFTITASGMNATVKSSSWFFSSAYALTPPPLFDAHMANVELLEAWIVVKHVHFFRSSNPDAYSTSKDHYKGPFFVDLLDGTPESFGKIAMYPEGLRRVKMLLHKAKSLPDGVPAALTGNSIYLRGQVNGVNFTYASDETTDFQIYGERAVVPESGKKLMVTIRIADLFRKIDLSIITTDTDISAKNRVSAMNPCPLIHPAAQNLYTCFRQGVNKEAKFGKDEGDDDLDDSETVN